MMTPGNYALLRSLWLQCRLEETQVEQAYQLNKITLAERDEILSMTRNRG